MSPHRHYEAIISLYRGSWETYRVGQKSVTIQPKQLQFVSDFRCDAEIVICYRKLLDKLNDIHFINAFMVYDVIDAIYQKRRFVRCDFSFGHGLDMGTFRTPTYSHACQETNYH